MSTTRPQMMIHSEDLHIPETNYYDTDSLN